MESDSLLVDSKKANKELATHDNSTYNTMSDAPTTTPPIVPNRATRRSPSTGFVFARSVVLWLSVVMIILTLLVIMRKIVFHRLLFHAPPLLPFPNAVNNHTRSVPLTFVR